MPDFNGIENFQLILLFVVPGLIALFVRSRFIAGRAPSVTENALVFIVLSLVFIVLSLFYYSFTIFFVKPVFALQEPGVLQTLAWITLILIGPAIFGFILGTAAQKEWFTHFANWFGLAVVHIIPTAWDWRFSNIPRDGVFIMVTLTSGERVAGLFKDRSFASSDTGERDLYIEEEYTVSDDGVWEARPEKVGVLISAKEIRYVEFWNSQAVNPQAIESAHG